MSVALWFAPSTRYPGGFRSNYNSLEEALAQAVSDIAVGREPGPVRIEAEDGSILADAKSFKDAAKQSA